MPLMNNITRAYLDYNSTTPCAAEVIAEMLPYFDKEYGNAASPHGAGRVASAAVAQAREEVACAIGTNSRCVFFTSGATESNNLALLGVAKSDSHRRKIVVSAIEHKSVLEPCLRLFNEGYTIERMPVDRNGVVDLEVAASLIDDRTLIVSVQGANNETGVLQPIREITQLAHERGALCHCDAAQMLGKLPVRVEELEIDLASFSAHKTYGPKGIGALFLAEGKVRSILRPLLSGGGQESGIRPGTQNVPGIVGFGCAGRLLHGTLDAEMQRLSVLRHLCEKELLRCIPGSYVNGRNVPRLPSTISLTIPGVPADMLMANLPTVCISNGSACNAGSPEPSHVLLAMRLSRLDAECTVRISFGKYTSEADIVAACREMTAAARELRVKLGLESDFMQSNGGNRDA
jgi:cysteine desulfurase